MAAEILTGSASETSVASVSPTRPVHDVAKKGEQQIRKWIISLHGPQRMSQTASILHIVTTCFGLATRELL